MSEIELGDKVRCMHTGFTGIAVAKSEFINGCVQFMVAPRVKKTNQIPEEIGIDEHSLEIITTKRKKKLIKKETGGPMTRGLSRRGF